MNRPPDTVSARMRITTHHEGGRRLVEALRRGNGDRLVKRSGMILRSSWSMQQMALNLLNVQEISPAETVAAFAMAPIRGKPLGRTEETMPAYTCGELFERLQAIRMADHELAIICGVSVEAVQNWLGKGPRMVSPPAYLRVLMALLAIPENWETADKIVDSLAVEKIRAGVAA